MKRILILLLPTKLFKLIDTNEKALSAPWLELYETKSVDDQVVPPLVEICTLAVSPEAIL